jgi:hypothetical protein
MAELVTERGKEMLRDGDGYLYVRHREDRDGNTKWRCKEERRSSCNARLTTAAGGDDVLGRTGNHCHVASAVQASVAAFQTQLKRRRVEEGPLNREAVSQVLATQSQEVLGALPTRANLQRNLRRGNARGPRPEQETEDWDFSLPADLLEVGGDQWNFADVWVGGERILGFATETMRRAVSSAGAWYLDGTFRTCPKPFAQVWILLAVVGSHCVPGALFLLPGKKEALYLAALRCLLTVLPSAPQVATVMADFELAETNAVRRLQLPGVKVLLCFYHLQQSVVRKLQDMGGLAIRRYGMEPDFQSWVKKLVCMSFVPVPDFLRKWEEFTELVPDDEQLEQLVAWFESVYVGVVFGRAGRRRQARYPHHDWNHYHTLLNDGAKTNNLSEGKNSGLRCLFGNRKPTLHAWLRTIRTEATTAALDYQHHLRGDEVVKNKKYRALSKRMKTAALNFPYLTLDEYLSGLAHNLGGQIHIPVPNPAERHD